eukprot:CAMPEP_0197696450 /NCGR_PEP_ID=MMETSP1338-20131121/116631_1 /TAXON_ID=43686 ORGANISM="Pelagodinium beii, Strain RCC1491" /NCGR_SAMPLE_ID=MMETSP1338 /ASSEMBLY_ACC=CAM_ASM_000754 /LENGTH=580 /DNA_ID=CAMNT_0043279567 /DNA_START=137 /DNA_END=1879 /DNA_ORIENTATION=-
MAQQQSRLILGQDALMVGQENIKEVLVRLCDIVAGLSNGAPDAELLAGLQVAGTAGGLAGHWQNGSANGSNGQAMVPTLDMQNASAVANDDDDDVVSKPPTPRKRSSVVKENSTKRSYIAGQKTLETRKNATLRRIFTIAEEADRESLELAEEKKDRLKYYKKRWSDRERLDKTVDIIVGFVILANAVLIGVSMDYPEYVQFWLVNDIGFSAIFIAEISFKIFIHGGRGHFCGAQWASNSFDAFLIFLDLLQLFIEVTFPVAARELESAPSASLFRVIRLMRLSRLLRAMKSDIFKSLSEMVNGIAAGMVTLGWSFLLFVFFIYVVALILRESLGRPSHDSVENVTEMFNNVPRAMLTTFRCGFGDCSAPTGVPIFEHVLSNYGASGGSYMLLYTIITFFISIVIFNVISAMFVESTMNVAQMLRKEKKRIKLSNEKVLFSKVARLMHCIVEHAGPEIELPGPLTESLDYLLQTDVPTHVIDEVSTDPEVIQILNDLDIHPQDHARLSDIFDPDNGGSVFIGDVAVGIRRLRGEARRSDIMAIDLMIRSVQPVLAEILESVQNLWKLQMNTYSAVKQKSH